MSTEYNLAILEDLRSSDEIALLARVTRDLRRAALVLTDSEARYLVDLYYTTQDIRIRAAAQVRSATDEPNALLTWVFGSFEAVERTCKYALDKYSLRTRPGRWLRSIHGVGPVIAAGFLAHLDVTKTPTAGGFWRFAGYDPDVKWERGKKRPWNADLKTLCWKLSGSFVIHRASDKDYYGHLYEQRKAQEVARNESGQNAETARITLEERNIRDVATRKCYESGKLPDGRVDLRARRWTAKIFLSHLHHVMYVDEYGEPPPIPYAFSHLGHGHYIPIPGWPIE